MVIILFLLLKKSVIIKNNTITSFHSLFGIKINSGISIHLKRDSITDFTNYKSRNYYQNENKFEPTIHVEENIFEIYIDGNYLITLHNAKSKEKILNFFSKLNSEH